MDIRRPIIFLIAALAACSHQEPVLQPPAPSPPTPQPEQAIPVPQVEIEVMSFNSVDEYKRLAAEYVMRSNEEYTFSGKLPRMLPAVVVLSITVNAAGEITSVQVQRPPAQDDGESQVALASMRRTAQLPRPHNLAIGPGQSLDYSETFLFNADMRFQLRSLAPIQTADDE